MTSLALKFRFLFLLFLSIQFIGNCAFTRQITGADFSAYDLINEVNNIRASNGLPALQINSTLMNIAQTQSEYQASTHRSSHAGPSGEIITVRVEASGYGNGAKIAAGENVAGFSAGMADMLQVVVYEIWADPVHRGTMINPKYQDAGAGIATDGETVYITLNLAGIISDDKPSGTISATNQSQPAPQNTSGNSNPVILPLFTSTPLSDGAVYHMVGYGQTLSTIARIYQIDILDLVNLNQIEPDKIFAGQKLLVIPAGKVLPTGTTIVTDPPAMTKTFVPTVTPEFTPSETATARLTPKPPLINTKDTGLFLIFVIFGIIIVASLMYFNRPPSR